MMPGFCAAFSPTVVSRESLDVVCTERRCFDEGGLGAQGDFRYVSRS